MSPLVWDLAHIGNQEELWLLRTVGGQDPIHPEIDTLYDAFEHPRSERPSLPLLPPGEARTYAADVRGRVLDVLAGARFTGTPLATGGFAFGMVVQHEQQHDETMLITHQLRRGAPVLAAPPARGPAGRRDQPARRGRSWPAARSRWAPAASPGRWTTSGRRTRSHVPPFWIDTTPVSNAAYQAFIDDGGYDDPRWWTPAGWDAPAADRAGRPAVLAAGGRRVGPRRASASPSR